MIIAATLFSILVTMIGPVILAVILIRHYKVSWWLVLVGAGTFIASQAVHLPILQVFTPLYTAGKIVPLTSEFYYLGYSVALGLFAGLCEESSRWAGYKLIKDRGKSWGAALTLGAGHGGIESILLVGVPLVINLIAMIQSAASSSSGAGQITQLEILWGTPWTTFLAPAVERVGAMIMQITLSVMVWRVVMKDRVAWWLGAVLWHAFIDAFMVMLTFGKVGTWEIEGIFMLFTLGNLVFLRWMSQRAARELSPQIVSDTPA